MVSVAQILVTQGPSDLACSPEMGHKEPMSIASALRQIQDRKLILPAIQREYVWKPSQIIRVFDSFMRGNPAGRFLSWKVLPETIGKFKFYGFMTEYSAFDNRHNPVIDISTDRGVVAILDGQQRLTSLDFGLRGTHAWKNHGGWRTRRGLIPTANCMYSNSCGLKYRWVNY